MSVNFTSSAMAKKPNPTQDPETLERKNKHSVVNIDRITKKPK